MESELLLQALTDLNVRALTGKRRLPRNLTHKPDLVGVNGNPALTGRVLIGGNCLVTGKLYVVVVDPNGLADYLAMRKCAKDAFPYLAPEEREFIISGTSPEGFDKLFGEDNAIVREEARAIEIAAANKLPELEDDFFQREGEWFAERFELTAAEYADLVENQAAH